MNPLYSAVLTFALPLVGGTLAARGLKAAGRTTDPLLTLSRYQKHVNNFLFTPISSVLSLWALSAGQIKLAALPAIGFSYHAIGALVALVIARFMQMPGRQRGVFVMAGMNSNLGLIGGLLCYLFFGETGYALASFFRLTEMPFYYLIGYPAASAIGSGEKITPRAAWRQITGDPAIYLPVIGIISGLALSAFGVHRPAWLGSVNALLIPLSTINLAFAVGITLRLGAVKEHLRACSAMAALKFAMLPALVWGLGHLTGLAAAAGGLPFRVSLLLSFMPVGFTAILSATLFDLDEDLACALWLSTTLLLVPIMPLVKPLFG